MKQKFALSCAIGLAALGLASLTATANTAPLGKVSPPVSGGLIQDRQDVHFGRHHGFRHGRFFFGGPIYYNYSPSCWWSRRYHRWVCPYY